MAWQVINSLSGTRESQPYTTEAAATRVCAALNMQAYHAGMGGQYTVQEVVGTARTRVTHTVSLLQCTRPNALIGECYGAMAYSTSGSDFECEDCGNPLNECDLILDPNETLAVDTLDDRVYIIGCHPDSVQSLNGEQS